MKRIKVSDPTKLARGLGLILIIILFPVLISTLFGNKEPQVELTPEAEQNLGQPLTLYQGPFLDLAKLPEWLETVEVKQIKYPEDGVRGLYISSFAAGNEELMEQNIKLVESTSLNAMVIDFKDDYGLVRVDTKSDNPLIKELTEEIYTKELIDDLKARGIYTIARIVVFRDPGLAATHPDMAFIQANGLPLATEGQAFVNPLMQEVWDYNVAIALEAIELGFDEIQFDYVRFAEGFEHEEPFLSFSKGKFSSIEDPIVRNQTAITEFIGYARQRINAYRVKLSVDVFGYIAFDSGSGIGQDMPSIIQQVDVLSAMIYPSHWGPGYFGLTAPDTQPYEVIKAYLEKEREVFSGVTSQPITRPWLQAFTAEYLGPGYYLDYGKAEIEAQIKALKDGGVNEYLLWRSTSRYPEGVNY